MTFIRANTEEEFKKILFKPKLKVSSVYQRNDKILNCLISFVEVEKDLPVIFIRYNIKKKYFFKLKNEKFLTFKLLFKKYNIPYSIIKLKSLKKRKYNRKLFEEYIKIDEKYIDSNEIHKTLKKL